MASSVTSIATASPHTLGEERERDRLERRVRRVTVASRSSPHEAKRAIGEQSRPLGRCCAGGGSDRLGRDSRLTRDSQTGRGPGSSAAALESAQRRDALSLPKFVGEFYCASVCTDAEPVRTCMTCSSDFQSPTPAQDLLARSSRVVVASRFAPDGKTTGRVWRCCCSVTWWPPWKGLPTATAASRRSPSTR
jgi:hypothetical protein